MRTASSPKPHAVLTRTTDSGDHAPASERRLKAVKVDLDALDLLFEGDCSTVPSRAVSFAMRVLSSASTELRMLAEAADPSCSPDLGEIVRAIIIVYSRLGCACDLIRSIYDAEHPERNKR